MEEFPVPLNIDQTEIDDEDVVMPDKMEANPYPSQDFVSTRFTSR